MNGRSDPHDNSVPSAWMARFAALVAPNARVLDVAAGRGRHARFFAARGAHVTAVDTDANALAVLDRVPGVTTHVADLEGGPWPFADAAFDAVVVANYLHRPRFANLLDALVPDGVLLYETFAAGNEAFGRPANPAFLLHRDELLERVRGRLSIVAFEQGRTGANDRVAVVQRIAAVGRERAWPSLLSPGVG